MSVFNEISTGGVSVSGCAWFQHLDQLHTTWGRGDILYNVNKARRGVLEKVVIKKQRIIRNTRTQGAFTVLYIDTYNALWNEWDLVPFADAQLLAVTYLQRLLDELDKIPSCV